MAVFSNKLEMDAKQHNSEMNRAGESVKEYDRKIRETERDTKRLLAAQKKQLQETQRLRKEMKELGSSMSNAFGSKLGINLGAFSGKMAIATTAAAALGAAIKYNIQTAAEFEESMSRLSSITGATGKDLEFYKKAAIELGSTTTQSAKEVAESFAIIGSKTPELLKNKEALKEVTAAAITLGEAANMSVNDAATALTGVLNQFKLPATQAKDVINMLAAASKEGAGDIKYLNSAIVNCGSVASSMGISVDKVIAITEQLAQAGMDASSAGNNLKNIFLALETSTDRNLRPSVVGITTALENLKAKGLSTVEMVKLFGKENIAAATVILNSTDKIKEMNTAIQGTNTAYEQAKTNTDNLKGSLKSLSSAWEGLNLTINDSSGNLKVFIDWCTSAINAVTNLIRKYQELGLMQKEVANGGATQYVPYKDSKGNTLIDVGSKLDELKNRYRGSSRGAGRTAMAQQAKAELDQLEKEIDNSIAMAKKVGGAWSSDKNKSKAMIDALTHQKQQVALARKEFNQYTLDLERNEAQQRDLARQAQETAKITTPSSTSGGHSSRGGGHTPKTKVNVEPKFEAGSLDDLEDQLSKLFKKRTSENLTVDEIISLDRAIAELEVRVQDKKIELKIEPTIDYSSLSDSELQKLSELYTRSGDERLKKVQAQISFREYKKNYEDYKLPDISDETFGEASKKLKGYIDLLHTLQDTTLKDGVLYTILAGKIGEAEKALKKLTKEYKEDNLKKYKRALEDIKDEQEDVVYGIRGIGDSISGTVDSWGRLADVMSDDESNPILIFSAFASSLQTTVDNIANFAKAIDEVQQSMTAMKDAAKAAAAAEAAANAAEAASNLTVASSAAAAATGEASKSAAKLPFPFNLAGMAAAISAGLSLIAAITSIAGRFQNGGIVRKYATGGVVQGSTSIGDYNLARVNGGEMILNNRQQSHLWNLINANNSTNKSSISNGSVEFKIKGQELVGVLNNYNRKMNRI